MARVQITMLGKLEILVDGKPVLPQLAQSRKATMLLQYLLLRRGSRVPHKELTDALWGGDASGNPDMALRAILHRFRNMVEAEGLEPLRGCIVTNRGSYQWNTELDCEIDIYVLRDLMDELDREKDPARRIALCEQVVEGYKGRLLPSAAAEPWVERRSVQLHSRYQGALYTLLDHYRDSDPARVAELGRAALAVDPYDERTYMALILALKTLGRQAEAREVSRQAADMGCLHDADLPRTAYQWVQMAEREMDNEADGMFLELERGAYKPGAYLCDCSILKGVYQVQRRMEARYGLTTLLAMVTLVPADGKLPGVDGMADVMVLLGDIAQRTLRSCDVLSVYSRNQYLILLSGNTAENGATPMERLRAEFYKDPGHGDFLLTWRLYAPEPRPVLREEGRKK